MLAITGPDSWAQLESIVVFSIYALVIAIAGATNHTRVRLASRDRSGSPLPRGDRRLFPQTP